MITLLLITFAFIVGAFSLICFIAYLAIKIKKQSTKQEIERFAELKQEVLAMIDEIKARNKK